MRSLARALRALWWRRGTSVAILLVAALCVVAAVTGPLYVGAAGQQVVQRGLATAGADRTVVQVAVPATKDPRAARALAEELPPASATPGYPDRVLGLELAAGTFQPTGRSTGAGYALVAARGGACAHVALTAGRCPRRTGEVIIGTRTGTPLGWHLGTVLVQQQDFGLTPLTVVGTYRPRDGDDPWWAGLPVRPAASQTGDLPSVEPVLTTYATLDHQWFAGPLANHKDKPLAAAATYVPATATTCAHLRLTAGRCATGDSQALLSARTASRLGLKVGSTVDVPVSTSGTAVTVAGLYAPADPASAFWAEPGYLTDGNDSADLIVLDAGTYSEVAQEVTGTLTMPLRLAGVDLADPRQVRDSATTLIAAVASTVGDNAVSTGVNGVLAGIDHSLAGLRTLALIVVVQLLLLAWFVLYLVVAGASEARAGEVALAKLRGLRGGQTLRFGLLEPMLLVLLALPVGYLLALPVSIALAGPVTSGGAGVRPDLLSLAAALVAVAGGLLAVAVAARRVLTRPVLEQWRRSGGDRAGARAFSPADGVVLALAAVGLFELRSGSALRSSASKGGLALLGPALLSIAIAVVGVRLLPLACRAAIGLTRAGHGVGRFVAVRQVARRPAGLRLVVLLAVAVSLAWFAAAASGVATHNRTLRAESETGAAGVLSVAPGSTDLIDAVRRADPSGHAMAVGIVPPSDSAPGLLAVDTARLVSVPYWLDSYGGDPKALASKLRPSGQTRPIVVTGSTWHIDADLAVTNLNGVPAGQAGVPVTFRLPELHAGLVDSSGKTMSVSFGRMDLSRPRYTAVVPCEQGCRLRSLTLSPTDFGTGQTQYMLYLRGLGDATVWQLPNGLAGAQLATAGPGLVVTSPTAMGEPVVLQHGDVPTVLPVAITGAVAADSAAPPTATGLDGRDVPTQVVGQLSSVPVLGRDARLADLRTAQALVTSTQQAAQARYQVWLAPGADPRIVTRLRAQHVDVLAQTSVAGRTAQLAEQGPALALRLFLAAALAAAVLAAAATALTTYLSARRRSYELATLSVLAYPRSTLMAASLGEQSLLLVSGLVLGVLGGIAGSRLALGQVPLYSDHSPLPVDLAPPLGPLGLLMLALVVLVAAVAATSAALLVRSAQPSRLREAA